MRSFWACYPLLRWIEASTLHGKASHLTGFSQSNPSIRTCTSINMMTFVSFSVRCGRLVSHPVFPILFGRIVGNVFWLLTIWKRRERYWLMLIIFVRGMKSCKHLLLWCPDVYKLWTLVYESLEINWVIAASMREEIWARKSVSDRQKQVDIIPLSIFCVVWK